MRQVTLLQMLAGLLEPSKGDIVVGDKAVTGPGPDRGMVFQKDSVFPWMRVIDNVEYGLNAAARQPPSAARSPRTYLGVSACRMSSAPGRANFRAAC